MTWSTLVLHALDSFYLEHLYCGELEERRRGGSRLDDVYVRGGDRPSVGARSP